MDETHSRHDDPTSVMMLALWASLAIGLSLPWARPKPTPTRVAVLGGGFAGLTAARTLAAHPHVEVLLVDQREYFEYTPGILRAWVEPGVHRALVNPIRRLLRSKRATFRRVPPGCVCRLTERASTEESPLLFSLLDAGAADTAPSFEYECDYVVLATGGELNPLSDDRQLPDGSIRARRRRLKEQVRSVMENAKSALVVGGGLTGVELAAELVESLGDGTVTLAVGPTKPERGNYPGDPGAGLLPGFRDTCDQPLFNLGSGGASRYVRKWLQRRGVTILERWAVPPPAGATLANVTAGRRLPCARSWRDGGEGKRTHAGSWQKAGPEADIPADVVFDCRGIRPNTYESYTSDPDGRSSTLGVYAEAVAPSGWMWVDSKFRVSSVPPAAADSEALDPGLQTLYGGRVYCVGDAAEKDKQERTAANAHAEGEFVALDVLRAVNGKPPLPAYVAPARLCAISLGRWDGIVVLGRWIVLRGLPAAIVKALVQIYFVNFLPLPYWLMRRLPGRTPRRYMYGGSDDADYQLARSGGSSLLRRQSKQRAMISGGAPLPTALAVRPAGTSTAPPVDVEPAAALVVAAAAAVAAAGLAMGGLGRLARAGIIPI